jgi:hypothetical protein
VCGNCLIGGKLISGGITPEWAEVAMAYRVYSGERGARAISPRDKSRRPYTQFDSADDALTWAQRLREHGRVALLVMDDDGTQLGKQEIAAAIDPATGRKQTLPHRGAVDGSK